MPHLSPPLPVTIVVRNFFPPHVAAAASSSSLHNTTSTTISDVTDSSSLIPPSPPVLLHKSTSCIIDERYTLASRRVLRPVRLDIFARRRRRKLDGNDENDDFLLSKEGVVEEEEEEEEVMYSSTLMHPSSHPRWDHVDEGIQLDGGSAYLPYYSYSSSSSSHVRDNDNVQQRQSYDDVELYARFLVLLDDDESTTTTTDESSYNSNVVENGNDGVSNDCSGGERRRLRRRQWTTMVKIPLDSTKLCHLPNNMNGSNNDDNNETEEEEEEDDSFNNAIQIPTTLPLNTILIYYNDGYTRVLPALYHVLLQKHIIYDKIPQKNHVNGSFSSIDHDKLFKSLEDEGDNNNNSSVVANGSATAIVHAIAEDKIIDSTNINGYCSTAYDYVRTLSSKVDELPLLPQSTLPTSNKTMKIEKLRQLIQIEQQLLNHDEQQRINEGRNQLRSIMEQVQAMENEIHKSEDATGTERVNLFRNEIRCETNRIHLVMQLRCIFPIRVTHNETSVIHPPNYPKQQYMIANLPFPDDIHTPIVSDDQISAALGYVCQLVALASKYLDIPLRYTLICKASRSAILFVSIGEVTSFSSSSRGGMVYPLFRERGVIDREQLDYGLTLLDRNVNCLLRVRNVSYRNDWNLLAKIDRLLVHVIDGE